MSYEFTKLGAVEALTEMPENANALVEVDGAIKRVPANAASGGGSASGSAASLIVNIDVAAMAIDKPFTAVLSALSAGKPVRFQVTADDGSVNILHPCAYSESYIHLFQITHYNAMNPAGYVINSDGTISLRTGD